MDQVEQLVATTLQTELKDRLMSNVTRRSLIIVRHLVIPDYRQIGDDMCR